MKYNIKSFFSLLVTFGFLFSCAQAPQQVAEKTLVPTKNLAKEKAEGSTVLLLSRNGKTESLGMGFFVDKDKIATSIPVVAKSDPVFAKLSDKEKILSIEGVAAYDVKNNLVILKLTGKGNPLPIGDSNAVQKNESVSVVGYTDGKYNATTSTIENILKSNKWFWMKVATSKEISGSPVLNDNGQVIGTTVGYGDGSHNYVIPSNALKALLTKSAPLEPLTAWQKREHIRAEVHHSQGEQEYAAKKYKKAIVDFDRAIELNPEHVRAYYKRGNTKFKLENYTDAIEDYTHAIKLNPEHARAYNNRGNSKFQLENYTDAIDDYTHAIKIDSDNAKTYSNRGGAKIKLGESKLNGGDAENARNLYQEAIQDCTQAIKIVPGNYGAYEKRSIATAALGDAESTHGNTDKAQTLYLQSIADYVEYTQLKPSNTDASKTRVESKKGRASTVYLMSWTGISSGFSYGSGFFVDTDKIATNVHVVASDGPVFAKLKDKEAIWEVVGVTAFDVENDLVVLQLSGEGTPLLLADSDTVQIGETVITVGYPYGKYRVTKGKVYEIRNRDKWILTTPKTFPGNSGGPLLNSKHEVIGIDAQSGNYAYAIPSNTLKTLLARSELTESMVEWRKRELILAYAYLVQGHIKHIKKDYKGAITDLDTAIQLNPKFALAYYKREDVYESCKDYKAAIANYDKAIEQNPENAVFYQNRGDLKRHLGTSKIGKRSKLEKAQKFYQMAIDDYTNAIKIEPEFDLAYFKRGLTKHDLGESKEEQGDVAEAQQFYKAAIDDYTHAIKLNPKDSDIYNNRGVSKHDLGESKEEQGDVAEAQQFYKAAIDDYTHAIKLNPKDSDIYNNRGIVKKALGQEDEAEKDFAKAKELESKK